MRFVSDHFALSLPDQRVTRCGVAVAARYAHRDPGAVVIDFAGN